jgi:hypothetical protein
MSQLSTIEWTPSKGNPLPECTTEVSFDVTDIMPGTTRVRVSYKLLGPLVEFVVPSPVAKDAKKIRQGPSELVEEYRKKEGNEEADEEADESILTHVDRELKLKAVGKPASATLEVSLVDLTDSGEVLDHHSSRGSISFKLSVKTP